MSKHKMGRPPKDPSTVRDAVYQIRLTESEREAYDRAAASARMSLSEWIRQYLNKAAGVN